MVDPEFWMDEIDAEPQRWVSGQYHVRPQADAPTNQQMQDVLDACRFARMLQMFIDFKYRTKLNERLEADNEPTIGDDRQNPDEQY